MDVCKASVSGRCHIIMGPGAARAVRAGPPAEGPGGGKADGNTNWSGDINWDEDL